MVKISERLARKAFMAIGLTVTAKQSVTVLQKRINRIHALVDKTGTKPEGKMADVVAKLVLARQEGEDIVIEIEKHL